MNTKNRQSIIHVHTKADFEAGADRFFAWKLVKVVPELEAKFIRLISNKAKKDGIYCRCTRIKLKDCTKFKRVTK